MMIDYLARNQNLVKVAPWAGIVFSILLFANFSVYDPHFWGLINIPLYLFHQTEEHYVPGGFKKNYESRSYGTTRRTGKIN